MEKKNVYLTDTYLDFKKELDCYIQAVRSDCSNAFKSDKGHKLHLKDENNFTVGFLTIKPYDYSSVNGLLYKVTAEFGSNLKGVNIGCTIETIVKESAFINTIITEYMFKDGNGEYCMVTIHTADGLNSLKLEEIRDVR